ncbi:MAG: ribosome biogenesis GTPase Der [Oscillospiraceae bacterium]|nr:ribosome biogenesis GTPase Der [Oscillospiraceae bacterium]
MSKPLVALIGRPNVGKSTLFNKLSGKRISIVSNISGVTRDRIYADCHWNNVSFSLVDTSGLEQNCKDDDVIAKRSMQQTDLAIQTSDVILFVVDTKTGITAQDKDIASTLRKSNKPVIICANKCDKTGNDDIDFYEFYDLALGDVIPISSIHGHGTGDLLDKILMILGNCSEIHQKGDCVKVAIIGKPNVGKSSLINRIVGEERCVVSDVWGTTRDTTDSTISNNCGRFCFVDTAGLRKRSKVHEALERYSVIRAKIAIARSDVCALIIDADTGFTDQDVKIAGLVNKALKPCVIIVNKCDVKSGSEFHKRFKSDFLRKFAFLSWADIIFVSAKTGKRIDDLFVYVNRAFSSSSMRITTGRINYFLSDALLRVQPPTNKGKRLKIFYMTQVSAKPPTFVIFVNYKKLFHFSYKRYIENRLRETFSLNSTPVRFIIRERGEQSVNCRDYRSENSEQIKLSS